MHESVEQFYFEILIMNNNTLLIQTFNTSLNFQACGIRVRVTYALRPEYLGRSNLSRLLIESARMTVISEIKCLTRSIVFKVHNKV